MRFRTVAEFLAEATQGNTVRPSIAIKTGMFAVCVFSVLLLLVFNVFAQETTGGLQGTVKDPSGAVVGGAHVVVKGTTLVGEKALDAEPTGYYRFANLPPGVYSIEVFAKGFKTVKREGFAIEVGNLPTLARIIRECEEI